MTSEITTLEIRSASGAPVTLEIAAREDGTVLARGAVRMADRTIEGLFETPYDVPAHASYDRLRATGATHYARLAQAIVGLDAATAAQITSALEQAKKRAAELKRTSDAARAAQIRATHEVRWTLCYSPYWTPPYTMQESYEGGRSEWAGAIRYSLLGEPKFVVHRECPSLGAVKDRSPVGGSYNGHENYLWLLSDADRDLLLAETATLDARDSARRAANEIAETDRLAALRAVVVPPEALAAFQRFQGDADAAWESGDHEGAAALIRRYGDAIEAQGLAYAQIPGDAMELNPPGA